MQFNLAAIPRTTFIEEVIYRDQMPSTSDAALELVRDRGVKSITLVLTELQTAGRGQESRKWFAAEGSLTFSIIFPAGRLAGPVEQLLPLATGIACAITMNRQPLRPDAESVEIKWPNDLVVYRNGTWCKLGGILVENVVGAGGCDCFVIGIGLNVDNSLDEVPAWIQKSACSMRDLTGMGLCLDSMLVSVLRQMEKTLQSSYADLIYQINELSMLNGKTIQLQLPDSTMVGGICKGIAADGAILIAEWNSDGEASAYPSGTVVAWD